MLPRPSATTLALLVLMTLFLITPVAAQDTTNTVHTVRRGENLYRIALRYGVSMDAIAQANNITNQSRISAGQQLTIPNFDPTPAQVENPTVAGTPVKHLITGGETLASIANQYGMTVDQLLAINNIPNPNRILRGQELLVWATTPAEPAAPDANSPQITVAEPPPASVVEAAAPPPSTTYTVGVGEHLSQIADQFGISWVDIASANSIVDPNHIFAGQTLTIPGVAATGDAGGGAAAQPQFAPPPPTLYTGKQVVVDLSDQMVYAYQDGVLLRSLLVSTGLPGTPTVLGDYNVYHILESQRMVGPGYDLPGVPYVMYFYQGYALHGAYWHNNFGNPMSHGCVNMPPAEAEWFYSNFVELGTPVHVQV